MMTDDLSRKASTAPLSVRQALLLLAGVVLAISVVTAAGYVLLVQSGRSQARTMQGPAIVELRGTDLGVTIPPATQANSETWFTLPGAFASLNSPVSDGRRQVVAYSNPERGVGCNVQTLWNEQRYRALFDRPPQGSRALSTEGVPLEGDWSAYALEEPGLALFVLEGRPDERAPFVVVSVSWAGEASAYTGDLSRALERSLTEVLVPLQSR